MGGLESAAGWGEKVFCGRGLRVGRPVEAEGDEKVRNGGEKVRMGDEKVRNGDEKVRIEAFWTGLGVSQPTRQNIEKLYAEVGLENAFGEAVVAETCGLSRRGASRLIVLMRKNQMIEHRTGLGPGKYVFLDFFHIGG